MTTHTSSGSTQIFLIDFATGWSSNCDKGHPEDRRIDVTFSCSGKSHLAELKICYGANTRHAIREALGQIFEYNYYPPYDETQSWWLVLDHIPSANDCEYISTLRQRYDFPLIISWPEGTEFKAYPSLPL